ncbi:MAG: pantoate--beta-alanine ligase [Candidatus Eremiobacteraeota bacterium]|nr:pantoate--beta-alanine ligase [Candidatus Eremiobacteraeota bacterium]
MLIATTLAEARALLPVLPRPVGFVPTMGALHAGHLELLHVARKASASTIVSIFVNPLQFGANEDFANYPRDVQGDRSKLERAHVDALFLPNATEIYPDDFTTYVDAGAIGSTFEGVVRPRHFRGVATVVTKLLHIVQPDILFLGQKDAQQACVLRKMIVDLNMPLDVELVPTIREDDGLAMSSRNAYLSAEQRAAAPSLYRALLALREALEHGASKAEAAEIARATLSESATPDYFDVVDAATFEPIEQLVREAFVIGAARFGRTRLIDNLHIVPGRVETSVA